MKTVDRSVGSMKGRAVTRTGRYVSCITRRPDVSGDYAEDPLPLPPRVAGRYRLDTDSFQKLIPIPINYNRNLVMSRLL